jgi:alpha-mannosidase
VKEISLSHDSQLVEFTEQIHWRGLGGLLKLALNANMENPTCTYNWETSRIQRGINYEKCFEMPSRYWRDISDQDWGISIIDDSKYGSDNPHEDTLRLTLLYTPGIRYVTGFIDQKWHDWGDHTIRYALYGHEGDFKNTDKLARKFNQPIRSFSILNDISSEAKRSCSLCEISNDQIGILAVKKPENSEGILIRVYERFGQAGQTEINFNTEIQQVTRVNGLEERIEDIACSGTKFSIELEANQIRSYIVNFGDVQQVEPINQEVLKLDYDRKLIGPNGDPQALFPSEITPATIPKGAISYQLLPDAKLNSLQCHGQKISLPDNYNTLSILIGSTEACDTTLNWANYEGQALTEVKYHLSAMTGFRGQWDKRKWLLKPIHYLGYHRDYAWVNMCIGVQPGFINRDRIEWYSTHTHKNGEDQLYRYGYMQSLALEIPSGATTLILPDDKQIYIFAITASQQNIIVKSSQVLRDKFDF